MKAALTILELLAVVGPLASVYWVWSLQKRLDRAERNIERLVKALELVWTPDGDPNIACRGVRR